MKRNKTIKINGTTFEVRHAQRDQIPTTDMRWTYSDIFTAYDKPSDTKVFIWNIWKKWADETSDQFIDDTYISEWYVSSRNCFRFTIAGAGTYKGTPCGFTITAMHNYLCLYDL